jgi:hypothetical protein
MVRSTCKPPILQHPILIRHLFNSRKLQNIKVRRNAADQNEKKKKTKKDPHLKPNHWSHSSRPKTQPPAPESIHRSASHACPCDPWWDRPTTWVVSPNPRARQQEKLQEIAPALGNSNDVTRLKTIRPCTGEDENTRPCVVGLLSFSQPSFLLFFIL